MRARARGGAVVLFALSSLFLPATHPPGVAADEDIPLAAADDVVAANERIGAEATQMQSDMISKLSRGRPFEYFSSLRNKWGRSVSVLPKTTRVGWIGASDLGTSFVRTIVEAGYNVTVADRCSAAPDGSSYGKESCGTPRASSLAIHSLLACRVHLT